jgi:hypothetical protein
MTNERGFQRDILFIKKQSFFNPKAKKTARVSHRLSSRQTLDESSSFLSLSLYTPILTFSMQVAQLAATTPTPPTLEAAPRVLLYVQEGHTWLQPSIPQATRSAYVLLVSTD